MAENDGRLAVVFHSVGLALARQEEEVGFGVILHSNCKQVVAAPRRREVYPVTTQ